MGIFTKSQKLNLTLFGSKNQFFTKPHVLCLKADLGNDLDKSPTVMVGEGKEQQQNSVKIVAYLNPFALSPRPKFKVLKLNR